MRQILLFCVPLVVLAIVLLVVMFLIEYHPKIRIEPKCQFNNGTDGFCVKKSQCSEHVEFESRYIGGDCKTHKGTVCCSLGSFVDENSMSFEDHRNFAVFKHNGCGRKDNIIFNDEEQLKSPWIVSLGHQIPESHKKFTCGGSFITKNFILTSARCATDPKLSVIRLWNHKHCSESDENCADITKFNVIVHPEYDSEDHINDIALIKLEHSENRITPVCLPFTEKKLEEEVIELTVVGKMSKEIKERREYLVNYVSVPDCWNEFREFMKVNKISKKKAHPINKKKQFCGKVDDAKIHCDGEHGMPIQSRSLMVKKRHWIQYGIYSYGYESCDVPGVYTNVYNYLDWILDNVDS